MKPERATEDELYEEMRKRRVNMDELLKMGLTFEDLKDLARRLDALLERSPTDKHD
jgi:hypothetical protein